MQACLSPNGRVEYSGDLPLATLNVGTIEGIFTLTRAGAGRPWTIEGRVHPEWPISSLLYEPNAGMMFAGVHGGGGLWRSADGGASWARIARDMPSHVYSVQSQYVGAHCRLWVGVEPASLFHSNDLGETWVECAALKSMPGSEKWMFPPPPHIAHVKGVGWHDSSPDRLFVLVEQGGLFRTEDGGETFSEIGSYLDGSEKFYRDSHRVCISRSNPMLIYFATGDGLCRSDDGGRSWKYLLTRSSRIGYPDAMFIDPFDESKIVIGGPESAPQDWRVSQRANATVMVSFDKGETWCEKASGMGAPLKGNIEAMTRYAWTGHVAYLAGTATGQVFISEDGCESWSCLSDELPPISKAGHYRWFMSETERRAIEERMRAWRTVV